MTTGPAGGAGGAQASGRELDLRLGRRALAKKLIDGKALSEALLDMAARRVPLADVLLKKKLLDMPALAALRAEVPTTAPEGLEEKPTKDDPRVGQIVLAVKCDLRVEQTRFTTSYVGRLPRDPEPAALLLVTVDAIRHGLWVDFLESVRAQKGLVLPGVTPVLDCGRVEGSFAIVTRYRAGSLNLRTLLGRVGRLKLSEALRITREAATGLAGLHAKGIVHRVVEPENVVLGKDGVVQLRRAGIAFEPEGATGRTVFGPLHALAPEVVRGEAPDPMNDIYALGVAAHEMVTGVRPFEGESFADLKAQHLEQAPLRPDKIMKDVPEGVGEMLAWMLAKKPKERPSATKLVNVIQTLERNIERSGSTQRMQAHGDL